jgi:magnesium-transporting ATPase (P-type)
LGVVIINAIIGFVQESKAEKAIEALKQMLAPSAIALRNGKKASVSAADLVPGDVVLLQGGDKVPADLRVFRLKNLQIDEAQLTGESVPVQKCVDVLSGNVPLGDRSNSAFAGTLVTTGTGVGMVVATGDATQIGRIADTTHSTSDILQQGHYDRHCPVLWICVPAGTPYRPVGVTDVDGGRGAGCLGDSRRLACHHDHRPGHRRQANGGA